MVFELDDLEKLKQSCPMGELIQEDLPRKVRSDPKIGRDISNVPITQASSEREEEALLASLILKGGVNLSTGIASTRKISIVVEMVRSSSLGKLTHMEALFSTCIDECQGKWTFVTKKNKS